MKQKLQNLFFLFLLGTIGAKAQGPVITGDGFNPRIGDSYKMQYAQSIFGIPNLSGGNNVWDFSNLIDSSDAYIVSFVSPIGLDAADSFPQANIAEVTHNYFLDSLTQYLLTSDSSLGDVGDYYPNILSGGNELDRYTPQFKYMVYPMTVNTNYKYSYQDWESIANYTSNNIDSFVGIGYGTLKLPNATFDSVLCMYNGEFFKFVTNGTHYYLLTLQNNNYNFSDTAYKLFGGWSVLYNAGKTPLPLQISSFTASWQNKMPYLQWEAANTENTKAFNIQRSVDGHSFSTVGQVGVSGGSSYHFEDNYIPTSTVYYRIEQVDKNGQTFSSSTARLTVNGQPITVYPNPAKDVTTVQGKHIVSVQVINNSGRVVSVTELNDATNPSIKTNNLAAGIYYLHIKTTDGGESVVSFVKQ